MIFSKEELKFIREELGIDIGEEVIDEELLCKIQDEAFEIEIEESNRLEELTERGKMAVHLVTRLGME